jgi:DNA-binding NarL/FixJ family response regulator
VARDDGDQPVRILIVEDDPRVRTALRRFLSASDEIDVVGDAGTRDSALRLAEDLMPAVALVDVHLPNATDGLWLLQALTDLGVPVVAISIHSSVRASALAAGADQFLDKDSAPDLMVAALRRAAQRRPQPDRP